MFQIGREIVNHPDPLSVGLLFHVNNAPWNALKTYGYYNVFIHHSILFWTGGIAAATLPLTEHWNGKAVVLATFIVTDCTWLWPVGKSSSAVLFCCCCCCFKSLRYDPLIFVRYGYIKKSESAVTSLWRHNGRDSASNHQPHDCLPSMFPFDDVIMTRQVTSIAITRSSVQVSLQITSTFFEDPVEFMYGCLS